MLDTIYQALGDDQTVSLTIKRKDDKLVISIVVDNEDGDKGAPVLLKGNLETCISEFTEAITIATSETLDEIADGITKPEKVEKEAPAPKAVAKKVEAPKKEEKAKPLTEEDRIVIASRESIVKGDVDTYLAAIQKLNIFLRKNPKATKVIALRDALRVEKANEEEILGGATAPTPAKGESIDTVEAIATEIENEKEVADPPFAAGPSSPDPGAEEGLELPNEEDATPLFDGGTDDDVPNFEFA